MIPQAAMTDEMRQDRGLIYVFNTRDEARTVRILRGHRGVVHALAFAPSKGADMPQLASAAQESGKSPVIVRLWDSSRGVPIGEFATPETLPRGRVGLAAWRARDQPQTVRVAVACGDGNLTLWDSGRLQVVKDGSFNNTLVYQESRSRLLTGCFDGAGPPWSIAGLARWRRASGPSKVETNVNYQDVSPYWEFAFSQKFSAFVETPIRFVDPTKNGNAAGFADMNAGFKYALVAQRDRFHTFQFRTYIPTGNGQRGLGTNHVSLEPAILIFRQLSSRLFFIGEIRDWIPIGGSDFAGNILRYGMGLSYNVIQTDSHRVAPVAGWTCMGGQEFNGKVTRSAEGDTIVNAKIGLRFGLGDYREASGSALNDRHTFYFGYARALTTNVWYAMIPLPGSAGIRQ